MKTRSVINYKQSLSLKDIEQIRKDLEDIAALIEHQNEILTYKLRANPNIFAAFIKAQILVNTQSLGCIVKYYRLIDQAMQDFLQEADNQESGHT